MINIFCIIDQTLIIMLIYIDSNQIMRDLNVYIFPHSWRKLIFCLLSVIKIKPVYSFKTNLKIHITVCIRFYYIHIKKEHLRSIERLKETNCTSDFKIILQRILGFY